MKTNAEKFSYYCGQIKAKDAEAIAALIPGGVPSQFFVIRQYEAKPVTVTGLGVYRRGVYELSARDRITKAEVAQVQAMLESWEAPALADVLIHYREEGGFGTATGAHKHGKIEADPLLAWTAEELAPEIERRYALYSPREGHTACAYCRKQTLDADLVSRKIFYRDISGPSTKTGKYCSDQCGGYDQMGHEG